MRVTFERSVPQADHIFSFYFRPEKPMRYTAGQFIELTLPHDNPDERGIRHWFTLSSSPTEELLTITTKFAKGRSSTFKNTLGLLKPGDKVAMSDPMGDFVLPKDKSRPLVFVAGGIGVTPMRSMTKWLLDTKEKRDVRLIYAANNPGELVFGDLFKDYGLPVTYLISDPPSDWKGETGRLTAEHLLQLAPDNKGQLYYISGPEPMVEALYTDIHAMGVEKSHFVGDYFPNYTSI